MHSQSHTFSPDTDGPLQIPDQSTMLNEDANGDPTGTLNIPETSNPGAPSGSPNMEPDDSSAGTGEALGNNDGTEPDPEMTDPAVL